MLRLTADLAVSGDADSEVTINGLVIVGGAIVVDGDVSRVNIRHCTLVPGLDVKGDGTPVSAGAPSLVVRAPNVRVTIERSILGAIRADLGASVEIADSIVDANAADQIAYAATDGAGPGASLTVSNTTIVGRITAYELPMATNAILFADAADSGDWTAPVRVEKRQEGCVRFSYVPASASVPRRYRCRPGPDDDPIAMQAGVHVAALRRRRLLPARPARPGGDPHGRGRRSRDGRLPPALRAAAGEEPEAAARRIPALRPGGRDLLCQLRTQGGT